MLEIVLNRSEPSRTISEIYLEIVLNRSEPSRTISKLYLEIVLNRPELCLRTRIRPCFSEQII